MGLLFVTEAVEDVRVADHERSWSPAQGVRRRSETLHWCESDNSLACPFGLAAHNKRIWLRCG